MRVCTYILRDRYGLCFAKKCFICGSVSNVVGGDIIGTSTCFVVLQTIINAPVCQIHKGKPADIMEGKNQTAPSEFIILGFDHLNELQYLLFTIFFLTYICTLGGNVFIIVVTIADSHLHTPMYYFLSSLSFIDLCQSTVIIPKMLVNFVTVKNIISYPECMTQLYFFVTFAIAECHMLAVMAYDRYVAICSPLLYSSIMSQHKCLSIVLGVYIIGIVCASAHVGCMFRIDFCRYDVINHYFCDLISILKLSCSDAFVNELMIFILGGIIIIIPFLLIGMSYVRIFFSILKVPSTQGIHKVFSTCGSHLSVVSLFYGTIIGLYLCPSADNSTVKETVMAMMYTVVTPMLNPFIYSLRNRDMKRALIRIIGSKKISL